VNTDALELSPDEAKAKVLHLQRKLHKWASTDKHKRFCDLWNLVCDPAVLQTAWLRVRSNKGSRTAGVDGATRYYVENRYGVERFLFELRQELNDRSYRPLPVRERGIPKKRGQVRYLGIPTVASYRKRAQQAFGLPHDHPPVPSPHWAVATGSI